MHTSSADHSVKPPLITIPRRYNAAHDLLMRNVDRPDKTAFINASSGEKISFKELDKQAHSFAAYLRSNGFAPESRVMLAMLDTPQWPVVFLGCILAGVVPVAVNTMLTAQEFEYMLRDSRAQALVVSNSLLPVFKIAMKNLSPLRAVIVANSEDVAHSKESDQSDDNNNSDNNDEPAAEPLRLESILKKLFTEKTVNDSCADDVCFWLYSSGSTGAPKGTLHLHSHMLQTAELYGRGVLGICESDVTYSAAKLFFAYGLGNGLSFPLSVGATTLLLPGRPTAQQVFQLLEKYQPSIFYGVPTLYASLLAEPNKPQSSHLKLRLCASAGEPLPAEIGKKWTAQFGCDILDGIGSTEMLHIFLSNTPGQVRYGSTGQAVPGYALRIIGDDGLECADGEIGELQINGPSAALMYWNNREKTKNTFAGEWTRSGDKYTRSADGFYTYGGRSDDMLKVGGIYVSPFEVEASLMTHAAVLEVAVIGVMDHDQLVKPKAYVVLKTGQNASQEELKTHVKQQLAPYKYPRWIAFLSELPKTATGKIQRFKLRQSNQK
jgi:benzoate-CoA ligase